MATNVALLVALTLWLEARGEDENGMMMVADTIWNNSDGKKHKIEQAIMHPNRYACWTGADMTSLKPPDIRNLNEQNIWNFCCRLGYEMTNGWYQSASRATNYWRKDIDMKGWMYELEIIGTIGNHMFAKPKEGTR